MRLRSGIRAQRLASVLLALVLIVTASVNVRAQTNSGALDLLKPIGARSTAMGTAYAAEQGSEAIWWNPAGIARMAKPEFAIDHFADIFIVGGDAISVILPAGAVGVFGISARLFNYDTTSTTSGTGEEIGTTNPRSIALGATFAATFGQRLSAGMSLRVYQFSVVCSGACGEGFTTNPYTGYLDAGVQFRLTPSGPLQLGAVLSNIGPDLQIHDQPQADALPARVHVGLSYQPTSSTWDPALKVKGTAEFVSSLALSSKELHVGGEIGYASGSTQLFARAGYVLQAASEGGERGTGPSFGLGLANGRVQVDIARVFETLSTNFDKPPTY
ncbi:MAG: PorV/PorQ family protein, partial [bacterium]